MFVAQDLTPATAHVALGGAGLGTFIIRLIIWHELWRLVRFLWFIPTVGPFLVVVLGLLLVAVLVWRRRRGGFGRRFGPHRSRGGFSGYGSGPGPRDW